MTNAAVLRCHYVATGWWLRPDIRIMRISRGLRAIPTIMRTYSQAELGDVVYVELPEVGRLFTQGETFGVVESVKVCSTLLAWPAASGQAAAGGHIDHRRAGCMRSVLLLLNATLARRALLPCRPPLTCTPLWAVRSRRSTTTSPTSPPP